MITHEEARRLLRDGCVDPKILRAALDEALSRERTQARSVLPDRGPQRLPDSAVVLTPTEWNDLLETHETALTKLRELLAAATKDRDLYREGKTVVEHERDIYRKAIANALDTEDLDCLNAVADTEKVWRQALDEADAEKQKP